MFYFFFFSDNFSIFSATNKIIILIYKLQFIQQICSWSKSTIAALEKGINYVQKLTIKITKRRHWRPSGLDFEQINVYWAFSKYFSIHIQFWECRLFDNFWFNNLQLARKKFHLEVFFHFRAMLLFSCFFLVFSEQIKRTSEK